MATSNDLPLLLSRVLLGALFVTAGLGKLGDVAGFGGYMASGGVPAFLAWPVVLFEILGGLAIIAGALTRPVALALAAFCVLSGALYHFVPADQMQMTQFLKNLALAGGFVALAFAGPGRYAVDARRSGGATLA